MKDNWRNCVNNFVKSGLDEHKVCLRPPNKLQYLLDKYPHLSPVLKVRLTTCKSVNNDGVPNLIAQRALFIQNTIDLINHKKDAFPIWLNFTTQLLKTLHVLHFQVDPKRLSTEHK